MYIVWVLLTIADLVLKTQEYSSEFEVVDVTDPPTIPLYDTPDFEDLTLFYTKESAMQPFQCKELWQFQDYRSILEDYERKCFNEETGEVTVDRGRYPFVVVESNNRSHRDLLSKRLSEEFSGKVIYNPPECLTDHASLFRENNPLSKAFYALGIYAAAHSAKSNYLDRPVIVSGYWNYAAALALDEIFPNGTEPPPLDSDCYDFPKDLLVPDVTVFVHIRKSQSSNQMYKWLLEEQEEKPRWMKYLLSMGGHPIEVIESCVEDKTILIEMQRVIDKKFIYEEK